MNTEELNMLYERYLDEAEEVERNRKPGEGIFGIGKKPSDDPCHDRFVARLGAWMERLLESKPDSATVRDVLRVVYTAPKKHPQPASAYWVLIAVQSLTKDLIPCLCQADAAELTEEYNKTYKRWERLPVQKQILDGLKNAAK